MKEAVDFKLYLITDRKLFGDMPSFLSAVEEALEGGARALQLREKDLKIRELLKLAYRLREMTLAYGAKLFVNDRVDIALAADADGVHLGEGGMPVFAARKAVGRRMLLGVSTHGIGQAIEAEKEGADFITLGPVFETPSKVRYGKPLGVDVIRAAAGRISVPFFAIGGVSKANVREIMQAESHGVALISAVLASADIKTETEDLMRLLK
ncbi:MAG: thiamine phosphate synthase [Candidatus Sulfobium sp.]|jgi:thiamine-phosphate pyrophosphorylase